MHFPRFASRLSFHFVVFNYIAFSGKSSWLICSWFLYEIGHAKLQFVSAAPSTKCDTKIKQQQEKKRRSKYKLNLQLKGRKRLPWHCVHFVWHSALANKQLNAKCDTQRGWGSQQPEPAPALKPHPQPSPACLPAFHPQADAALIGAGHVPKYQLIKPVTNRRKTLAKSSQKNKLDYNRAEVSL